MKTILSLIFALILLVNCAPADVLGLYGGLANYYPSTGQVLVSTNGSALVLVESTDENIPVFIPGNAVPLNSMPTTPPGGYLLWDPPSPILIDYLTISGSLGTNGILDNFSMGAILPTGIGLVGGAVPNARFRWAIVGYGEFSDVIHIVPEPSSFLLAGIAGVGLFAVARKRRAV